MAAGERRDVLWFNTDINGAPLEVTDERGDIRWSGQYGSFGEVRRQAEGFTRLAKQSALPHQPLRYAGQYADSETSLHYNLFRYYDPQVGRFTVQDPIGLEGGWNLYQYAPNPNGWVDPLGLSPVSPKTILFSQDSINGVFEDGRNVNGLTHRLINDPSYINEVEPIRKVRMRDLPANVQERLLSQGAHKDSVFSLDNRRLYAAKEAGVSKIPSRWATPEELSKINFDRRFSTGDGGKSIRTRGCG
ncbi:RHS repeat-associated core domain-containing protein [Pantoea ananatis]|uniref:RHS repeat-associated core domain-containing protein n=1 Tax=Pantoea ananas TaxID=553 RepID=UPI003F652F0B